jgi:hypothetical protein
MANQQEAEQPQDAGEQRKERVAAGCLTAIGVTFAGTLAITVPETAYYTAGLLTAAGVRRARTWASRRREASETEEQEAELVDIVATLQQLGEGGEHVRLTQLQEAAGLPDTKAVRALLDEAGIRIRTGVRSGGKNGPGVHATDIPPLEAPPSDGCLCRSDANANTNNDVGEDPEKGFRVEHTGQAGITVYDLSETHQRRHAAKA